MKSAHHSHRLVGVDNTPRRENMAGTNPTQSVSLHIDIYRHVREQYYNGTVIVELPFFRPVARVILYLL